MQVANRCSSSALQFTAVLTGWRGGLGRTFLDLMCSVF